MTHPSDMAVLVERLRALLAEQAWAAAAWEHDIIPPGKAAHKLACDAIRALPTLLNALSTDQRTGQEVALAQGLQEDIAAIDTARKGSGQVEPYLAALAYRVEAHWPTLLAALTQSAPPVEADLREAVRTCDILPPRHMPEALPGATGCILPRGHFGDHIDRIGEGYYFWTDGQACDCCDPADPDRCFDFGKVPALQQTRSTPGAASYGSEREQWDQGCCDCPEPPFDDEVVYDRNLTPRCPRCNVALGGTPMTASERATQDAEEEAASPVPVDASGAFDRPFILAAARTWWAAKMPGTFVHSVAIKGDGRVDVAWSDDVDDGRYTLPVTFLQELAALHAAPAAEPDHIGGVWMPGPDEAPAAGEKRDAD